LGRLNFVLASRNENKLRELARVLGDWRLELLELAAVGIELIAAAQEEAVGAAAARS